MKAPFVPEIPENSYSLDKLEEMASKDYEKKNGTKPDAVEAYYNHDGSVTIYISTSEDASLDEYHVDPITGKGQNRNGEEINFPKTGNNAPEIAVKDSASAFTLLAGLFTAVKSGILRRKKEQ